MNIIDIITHKKLGLALTKEEIAYFVKAAADRAHSEVADYQLAALLMAIRLQGMTPEETTELTLAMRDSGDVADLSGIPGVKVDKHSTGGVGDTTTLILAPLVAACGVPVAKMSGRGLGHTGGTLDKLESIPGLSVEMDEERFVKQVREIGVAVIGQTGCLAPADKTLYALRDVTSTVDSLPLIASSIMSKKLASGADAIVLDVKTGSGAIMHTLEDSMALGRAMVEIGTLARKPVVAVVTGMEQPLGTHVGNALEVKDAIDVLSGRTQGDLLEVSLLLGSRMLVLAGRAATPEEGRSLLLEKLHSGEGLAALRRMIQSQGGDPRVCEDLSLLPQPKVIRTVPARVTGYVASMDTTALGMAAQAMGAGRLRKEDPLDYSVGFILPVRIGDRVTPETPLCTLYARSEEDADRADAAIRAAITFSDVPVAPPPRCYAILAPEARNEVPYIDQSERWPTGCESVSAAMLLQSLGVDVSVEDVIAALPKADLVQSPEGLRGPDPNRCFVGSPCDPEGFGCYAPVMADTLSRVLAEHDDPRRAVDLTGVPLETLEARWLAMGKPVLFWATIDLQPSRPGPAWTLPDGSTFRWRSNEHCMVLTGYDADHYYFNDPWHNHGPVAYDRALVAQRHQEMFAMAVGVE